MSSAAPESYAYESGSGLLLDLNLSLHSTTTATSPPSLSQQHQEPPADRKVVVVVDLTKIPSSSELEEQDGGSQNSSSTLSTLTRKRTHHHHPEAADEKNTSPSPGGGGGSDEELDGDNSRKKLRLSRDQSLLLEDTFKHHNTLNPRQKQALAKQLGLSARQVEVWFQNRRARTKLKQTEAECEYMKRNCQTLMDRVRRLQKEVNDLRSLKLAPQIFMHMPPATTLTLCPSCASSGVAVDSTNVGRVAMIHKPPF